MREELRNKGVVDLILHANKINVGIRVMGGEGIATNSSPILSAVTAALVLLMISAIGRAGGRGDGTAANCDGLLRSVASCGLQSSGSWFILVGTVRVGATPAICPVSEARVVASR